MAYTGLSDFELMQRVASSDSKALESLYDRYHSMLFTVIKKIVTDIEIAEEVLIDVFVILWRKISYFDFNQGNVYTWLITLARNKAVDTVRRTRANNAITEEYNDTYENFFIIPRLSKKIEPLDLETVNVLKDNIEQALQSLTDAQQYVIYLAYYEGLTQSEIAAKLNIPPQTVKSKIKIALTNLRDSLIKGGENG